MNHDSIALAVHYMPDDDITSGDPCEVRHDPSGSWARCMYYFQPTGSKATVRNGKYGKQCARLLARERAHWLEAAK